jgi:hypothetical protein
MDSNQISTIHDNVCKLIHKKCHYKIYHNDMNYHMTLNKIFSVVNMEWLGNKLWRK